MGAPEKTKILAVRVTEKMADRILKASTVNGFTQADWMRHVIAKAVEEAEKEMA